jgi:hypothetical protein
LQEPFPRTGGLPPAPGLGLGPAGQRPGRAGPRPAGGHRATDKTTAAVSPLDLIGTSSSAAAGEASSSADTGGWTPRRRAAEPLTYPPGRQQSGHFTVTEAGSNTSSSFTVVETAVVDYALSVDPTGHDVWDETAVLDYLDQQATGTQTQTDSFTTHVEGDGPNFQPDGGAWGGLGTSSSANPFSFGLFNYNQARFALGANWTQFAWNETGQGSSSLVDNESSSSTTTAGGATTASNQTSHEDDQFSESFSYRETGSNNNGQVTVNTYSAVVQEHNAQTLDAGTTLGSSPIQGSNGGDVVHAVAHQYQTSDTDATVTQ